MLVATIMESQVEGELPAVRRNYACFLALPNLLPNSQSTTAYLCGGQLNNGNATSAVEFWYSEAKMRDRWSTGPSMQERRSHAGGAVLGHHLYIIGGIDGDGRRMRSVEILDTAENSPAWQQGPGLTTAISHTAAVSVGRAILLIAGIGEFPNTDPTTPKKVTLVYQEPNLTWRSGPRLNYARAGHSAVTIGNVVYAIGGFGDGNVDDDVVGRSIEKLDTGKTPWKWELMTEQLLEKAVHATIISIVP